MAAGSSTRTCVEIKFYDAFVLNRRVVLHAIDAPDTLVDFHTDKDPAQVEQIHAVPPPAATDSQYSQAERFCDCFRLR